MKTLHLSSLLGIGCLLTLTISGCGSDDDGDVGICEDAFDAWCACPNVGCQGRPTSCTGPDKEWAECINAAADPCTASCDP
jgi:hypothetical protein